jgi:hypothetical protein
MSQMNPVHTLPPYFYRAHSNIMFLSTPLQGVLRFRFYDQNFICISHISYKAIIRRMTMALEMKTIRVITGMMMMMIAA